MSKPGKVLSKLKKLQKTKKFKKAKKIVKEEFSKVNTITLRPLEIVGIVLVSILGYQILFTAWGWAIYKNMLTDNNNFGKSKKNISKEKQEEQIKKTVKKVGTKLKKEGYKPWEIIGIIFIVLFGLEFTLQIFMLISSNYL